MVGPAIGKFSGGLANRADEVCPEKITRDWKYADGNGWVLDPLITIQCSANESGTVNMQILQILTKKM